MKLSIKFIISFLLVILLSIFLTSYISNFMINKEFNTYLIDEYDTRIEKISENINELYEKNDYTLYENQINSFANMEQVSISISDLDNVLLYSSSSNTNHMGNMHNNMIGRQRRRMMHNMNYPQGEYLERTYPLIKESFNVGIITIGFYDNSYITSSALVFSDTLSISFIISGIISISISLIAAIALSNTLTRPLIDLTNTTKEIKNGNLNAKPTIKSTTSEIIELSNSIDYLGEALKKEEDIRTQYAMDISHELRTPITTLKGYLEAISDGIWNADEEKVNILLEEVNRISNLVDDLKNSFLINSDDLNLNKIKFNLSNELINAINVFRPIFIQDNCKIITNIEDNVYTFMDKDKFKQIIFNLLSNAKKYIENDIGIVEVDLFCHEDTIFIKIRDNGIGIAQKDLNNIFNRFYRVDSSRNRDTGGTGLGLSIVKNIINSHNGKIYVTSSLNKGTEFTIELKKEAK